MRFLATIPLLVLALFFAHAGPAAAVDDCGSDPSAPGCQPWEVSMSATLTLNSPSWAHVTSSLSGLDCVGSCSKTSTYSAMCWPGEGCADYDYDVYELGVQNTPSGYAPSWSGCDSESGGQCSVELSSNKTVSLGFTDVTAPSVAFTPPAKAGTGTVIGASGGDNSGSFTYDWTVDGAALGTHAATIGLGAYAEGNHSVSVRTRDGAGLTSLTITKTIAVDTSVALGVPAPPAFTHAATVPVGYTTDGDVPDANRFCAVNGAAPVACSPAFSPVGAASPDGTYAYTVTVTDDVGNTATSAARSFVLDRTPPVVAFTDGPTEGQAVTTTKATLSFAVTDANASGAAPVCHLDGAIAPCTTATTLVLSNLGDGAHVVAVTATDKAGNTATKERRFTVKTETSTPGGGDGATGGDTGGSPGDVLDVGQGGAPRPPVLGAIAAGAGYNYAAMPAYTILTAFKVKGIPQGATVLVTCKGRSCPKARFTIRGAGVKPVKPLSNRRLKVGTVIEIRITKPGYIGRVVQIRIRARKAPSAKQLCLPVGASKAVACS